MFVTAIIAAAGRGERLGGVLPKQLLTIGGRAILERSVAVFLEHPDVDEIVVVLPAEVAADPPAYLRAASKPLKIVIGGLRRQDSVANGFAAAAERADVIVIHDAARPFASAGLITSLRAHRNGDYVALDGHTIRNLELFEAGLDRRRDGSLLQTLDLTSTSMGSRMLRRRIGQPLCDIAATVSQEYGVELDRVRTDAALFFESISPRRDSAHAGSRFVY